MKSNATSANLIIEAANVYLVTFRPDSGPAQPITKRELIFVDVKNSDGITGTGFVSTIGTGGHSVLALIRHDLIGRVVGKDAGRIEAVWNELYLSTFGTARGVITGLALAAIDIALWDLKGKVLGLPLWQLAGGYRDRVPIYEPEVGWLDLPTDALVEGAIKTKADGWFGSKFKIGKPDAQEDLERLMAVRQAVGPGFNLMIDANQTLTRTEAIRRAHVLENVGLYWFEEPLPADDIAGHRILGSSSSIPIAVGESVYSLAPYREYLESGAVGVLQPDVTRVGGITPWLKIAHLAEAFNVMVSPHVRTELSVSLAGAVPNGLAVENHSALRSVIKNGLKVVDGMAIAPSVPGVGIEWDDEALKRMGIE